MTAGQVATDLERETEPEVERYFFKYTFFAVEPAWRRLDAATRAEGKEALLEVLRQCSEQMPLRTFSLVGTRGDADFMVWCASPDLDGIQQLVARLLATGLGAYLHIPYSYLALTRMSQYLGEHKHVGQEHTQSLEQFGRRKYLFVYPFVKKREWYSLPFDQRQRIMGEHFRIGHKYPSVQIHTGYSFGLDDQEFTLAFETDSPADFLDLVLELRESEASRYTRFETPIFTCRAMSPAACLDLLGG